MLGKSAFVSALALAAALCAIPAHALQRVFVSSQGVDSPSCGPPASPCRSFTQAMALVDPGGEILALDSAGYGAVIVTKSVSIIGNPGFYAGISASTGNAVTIATAGANVVLRGLNINGIGATFGIYMADGSSLTVEKCVVSNFSNQGIHVDSASAIDVRIVDTVVRGNDSSGISVSSPGRLDVVNSVVTDNYVGIFPASTRGGTLRAHIASTVMSQNEYGLIADVQNNAAGTVKVDVAGSTASNNRVDGIRAQHTLGTVVLIVSDTSVTGNGSAGLHNMGGTFLTRGNNAVSNNVPDLSGTITLLGLN